MNGINEIKRANQATATSKEFSYTALRHGGAIVRRRNEVRTVDGPAATEFLTKIRDASPHRVRHLISELIEA